MILATAPFQEKAMPENQRDNSLQDVVVRVDTSGLSDRGLRRPGNEDHFLIAQID